MCSGKFKKQYSVIKNLKICVKATYERKIFLFFSSYNLSAYNYTKKTPLLWVYKKDSIKILKSSLLSAS